MSKADFILALKAERPNLRGSELAKLTGVSRQYVSAVLAGNGIETRVPANIRPSHRAEYKCWWSMIDRCTNPKNGRYKVYGARGIKVCERWRKSFPHFFEDMGVRPSSSHSIDRINNDGDYEPSNCRWATIEEQSANQRRKRRTRPKHEAHIYMEREDYERLKRAADRDLRSVAAQAWHYIRLALASEE